MSSLSGWNDCPKEVPARILIAFKGNYGISYPAAVQIDIFNVSLKYHKFSNVIDVKHLPTMVK